MRTIHIPTKPYSNLIVGIKGPDDPNQGRMASRNTDHVLSLVGTYHRFGLGYAEANTWTNNDHCQRVFTVEPDGYTFGLASCISANPEMSTGAEVRRNKADGIEHDVEDGDMIVTDYQYCFKVRLYRREFLALDYIGLWKDQA